MRQISVIGDSEANSYAVLLAEQVGSLLASLRCAVVTGGRDGIMEAANKGAFQAGGLSIGILPSESFSQANKYCHIVIPTGMGHARNALTAMACDAIVAIGGGAGTLSEICFSWIYKKPIFVFPQFGGWAEKTAYSKIDGRNNQEIIACASVEDLTFKLKSLFMH